MLYKPAQLKVPPFPLMYLSSSLKKATGNFGTSPPPAWRIHGERVPPPPALQVFFP